MPIPVPKINVLKDFLSINIILHYDDPKCTSLAATTCFEPSHVEIGSNGTTGREIGLDECLLCVADNNAAGQGLFVVSVCIN